DLFGGKLKSDKDFTLAKSIELSQGEIDTERVICNGKAFDFYFTDKAQWLLGVGDVIYTLEKPTGMEPEHYAAGYSGPSFDCTQAKVTSEKLICYDASLSKTDKKLGAEYAALKASLSPESFATFQAAQKGWIAYAAKICNANVPMPDNSGDMNT